MATYREAYSRTTKVVYATYWLPPEAWLIAS
jgi:hypothetical protein